MKNNKLNIIIAAFVAALFVACSDDKVVAPVITLSEVGHDNSHNATAGSDMHLEADIVAEGLIKAIYVEMHLEDGGKYEIERSFTDGKYIGVKNANFHEHIDIPADAPIGEYHLHFTVADRKGQQSAATSHVNIVSPAED